MGRSPRRKRSKEFPNMSGAGSSPYHLDTFEDTDDDFVDYPMSPNMSSGDNNSFPSVNDSENSDGWSDDSAQTSDDDMGDLGGFGSKTPLPPSAFSVGGVHPQKGVDIDGLEEFPPRSDPPASAKSLPSNVRHEADDDDDDDSDEDDPYDHSGLGTSPYMLKKEKSRSEVMADTRPPSPPASPPPGGRRLSADLEETEYASPGRPKTPDSPVLGNSSPTKPATGMEPAQYDQVSEEIGGDAEKLNDIAGSQATSFVISPSHDDVPDYDPNHSGYDDTPSFEVVEVPLEEARAVPGLAPVPLSPQSRQKASLYDPGMLSPKKEARPDTIPISPRKQASIPQFSPQKLQAPQAESAHLHAFPRAQQQSPRHYSPRHTSGGPIYDAEGNYLGDRGEATFEPLHEEPTSEGYNKPSTPRFDRQPYDAEHGGVLPSPAVYNKDYDHGRDGPQYISSNPSQDPYYDPNKDPRNFPPAPESPQRHVPAVHRAVYPDADDSEFAGSSRRPRGDDSVSFLGSTKRERRFMLSLVICLGCSLVCLAALVGGIVGAAVLGGDDGGAVAPVAPAPTETSPPPVNPPTDPPVNPPTDPPVNPPTDPPVETPVQTPVPEPVITDAPTAAPTVAPSAPLSLAPTGEPPFPADQALFDLVKANSFDDGTSLLVEDSPQNRAYKWLENDSFKDDLSDSRKLQRYALATFFYSSGGDSWKNKGGWLEGIDECVWYTDATATFSCGDGNVFSTLELKENNVIGTIPPEIGMLTSLTRVAILNTPGGAGLTGGFPKELGLATNMLEVEFDGNKFTEALPPEMFVSWVFLNKLLIAGNTIPGPIPETVGNLVTVERINLQDNAFEGTIPTSIGQLTNSKNLFLNNNQLTGPIPSEIGNMLELKAALDLSNNELSGPVPDIFSTLTELRSLTLQNNLLEGTPPTLAGLGNLRTIRIDGNLFTGTVSIPFCAAVAARGAAAYADCPDEVVCTCCTHCCVKGECVQV